MAGVDWLHGDEVALFRCGVCDDDRPKPALVESDGWGGGRVRFHTCPACGSVVRDQRSGPPPAGGAPFSAGSVLYVEQGAGIDVVLEGVARVAAPGVRRFLEIGCNFGFVLDFARHGYGWEVTGIDPSSAAQAGREELSLPIRCEEISPTTELGPPFDLILASEVIEHLAAPRDLTRSAARHLAPEGVLALTTPNAAGLRPDADPLEVERILSHGLHELVFTARALGDLLRAEGFAHVLIEETPTTLRGFASRDAAALERVRAPRRLDRALYRRWLDERARTAPEGSALASGLAYRHLKECVNAGDMAAARPSRERLRRALASRYAVDLDAPETLTRAATAAAGPDIGRTSPANATGALYFSGLLALNERRHADAVVLLEAAHACGVHTRRALPEWADGETADLMQQAAGLAAQARAAGAPEQPRGLAAAAVAAAGRVLVAVAEAGHHANAAGRELPRVLDALAPGARASAFLGRFPNVVAGQRRLWTRVSEAWARAQTEAWARAIAAATHVEERWPGEQRLAGAREVAIFVHFDPRGRVHRYVLRYLDQLAAAGFATVVVSNAPVLGEGALADLAPRAAAILRRRNVGLDFGAWKDGLLELDLARVETLLLANDSVYGPLRPLGEVLAAMPPAEADVWGVTDTWDRQYHLQSYFLLFHARALRSAAFTGFWEWLPFVGSKAWAIENGEIGLSQRLLSAGLRLRALCPYQELVDQVSRDVLERAALEAAEGPLRARLADLYGAIERGDALNPTHSFWEPLVRGRCPFLKSALLRENPIRVPLVHTWRRVLREATSYDLDLIEEHLRATVAGHAP